MPAYTLTIAWKQPSYGVDTYDPSTGALNGGPHYRRLMAIAVAVQYSVTDPLGHQFHPYSPYIAEVPNVGAQWRVLGTDKNICTMIAAWCRHVSLP
jgi:hypothetical protein